MTFQTKTFKERNDAFKEELVSLCIKHGLIMAVTFIPRNLFAKIFERFIKVTYILSMNDIDKTIRKP